jgi:hypothetical protein
MAKTRPELMGTYVRFIQCSAKGRQKTVCGIPAQGLRKPQAAFLNEMTAVAGKVAQVLRDRSRGSAGVGRSGSSLAPGNDLLCAGRSNFSLWLCGDL